MGVLWEVLGLQLFVRNSASMKGVIMSGDHIQIRSTAAEGGA